MSFFVEIFRQLIFFKREIFRYFRGVASVGSEGGGGRGGGVGRLFRIITLYLPDFTSVCLWGYVSDYRDAG